MTLHAVTLAAEDVPDRTDAPNSQLRWPPSLDRHRGPPDHAREVHPFLALMLGTAVTGAVAGVAPLDIVNSFTLGFAPRWGRWAC